jgi:hypothetical protein
MKDNSILLFVKWGNRKYLEPFYNEGLMYFNTVNYFAKLENDECIGDSYEGVDSLFHSENISVKMTPPGMDEIILNSETGLIGDLRISSEKTMISNLYSISAITWRYLLEKNLFTEEFVQFGDSAVVITHPKEFINRFYNAMKTQDYSYTMGLVKYYDKNHEGEIGIYKKREQYKFQKEYRINIHRYDNNPFVINIGSIKDISFISDSLKVYQMPFEIKPISNGI